MSPTLPAVTLQSCGTNQYCYTVYPDTSNLINATSTTIRIADIDRNAAVSYHINFVTATIPCKGPVIKFEYEQIDVAYSYEYISIYNNNDILLQQCQGNGGVAAQCDVNYTINNPREHFFSE